MIALDEAPLTQSLQCLWRGKAVVGQRYNQRRQQQKGGGAGDMSSYSNADVGEKSADGGGHTDKPSGSEDVAFINEVPISMCIPPTVVFEHNFPKGLYFASPATRRLSRRVGRDVDSTTCFEALMNVEETFGWGNSNSNANGNGATAAAVSSNQNRSSSSVGMDGNNTSGATARSNVNTMANSSGGKATTRQFGELSSQLIKQAAAQEQKLPGKHAHAKGNEADIVAMFVEMDLEGDGEGSEGHHKSNPLQQNSHHQSSSAGGNSSSYSTHTPHTVRRTQKDRRPIVRTHYFTEAGLRLFLLSSFSSTSAAGQHSSGANNSIKRTDPQMVDAFTTNNKHGILQRFLYPIGKHNELIQVVWTPQMFFVEKCQTKAVMGDIHLTPFQRAATFEAPENFTTRTYVSPSIYEQLRASSDELVANLAAIERKAVSNAVLFFKVDEFGVLWFLFIIQVTFAQPLLQQSSHATSASSSSPHSSHRVGGARVGGDGAVGHGSGDAGAERPSSSHAPLSTYSSASGSRPASAGPMSSSASAGLFGVKPRAPRVKKEDDVTGLIPVFALPPSVDASRFLAPITLRDLPPPSGSGAERGGEYGHQHVNNSSAHNNSRRQRAVPVEMLHPAPHYRMVQGGLFASMGEDEVLRFGKDLRVDFCGSGVNLSANTVCPTAMGHQRRYEPHPNQQQQFANSYSHPGEHSTRGGFNATSSLNRTTGTMGGTQRSLQIQQQQQAAADRAERSMPKPHQQGSILTSYYYTDNDNPFVAPLVECGSNVRGTTFSTLKGSKLMQRAELNRTRHNSAATHRYPQNKGATHGGVEFQQQRGQYHALPPLTEFNGDTALDRALRGRARANAAAAANATAAMAAERQRMIEQKALTKAKGAATAGGAVGGAGGHSGGGDDVSSSAYLANTSGEGSASGGDGGLLSLHDGGKRHQQRRKRSLADLDDAIAQEPNPASPERARGLLLASAMSPAGAHGGGRNDSINALSPIPANAAAVGAATTSTTASPSAKSSAAKRKEADAPPPPMGSAPDEVSLALDHIEEASMVDRVSIESRAGKRALLKMARDRGEERQHHREHDDACGDSPPRQQRRGRHASFQDATLGDLSAVSCASHHAQHNASSSPDGMALLYAYPEEVTYVLASAHAAAANLLLQQCMEPLLGTSAVNGPTTASPPSHAVAAAFTSVLKGNANGNNTASSSSSKCASTLAMSSALSEGDAKALAHRYAHGGGADPLVEGEGPPPSLSPSRSTPPPADSPIARLCCYLQLKCKARRSALGAVSFILCLIERCLGESPANQTIIGGGVVGTAAASASSGGGLPLIFSTPCHPKATLHCTVGTERGLDELRRIVTLWLQRLVPSAASSTIAGVVEAAVPSSALSSASMNSTHTDEGCDALVTDRTILEALRTYLDKCTRLAQSSSSTSSATSPAIRDNDAVAKKERDTTDADADSDDGEGDGGSGSSSSTSAPLCAASVPLGDAIRSSILMATPAGAAQYAVDATTYYMLWRGKARELRGSTPLPRSAPTVASKSRQQPPPQLLPIYCYRISNAKAFGYTLQSHLVEFLAVTIRSALDEADEAAVAEAFSEGAVAPWGRVADADILAALAVEDREEEEKVSPQSPVAASAPSHTQPAKGAEADNEPPQHASSPLGLMADAAGASAAAEPSTPEEEGAHPTGAEGEEEPQQRRNSDSIAGEVAAREVVEEAATNATIAVVEAQPLTPPPEAVAREATSAATAAAMLSMAASADGE